MTRCLPLLAALALAAAFPPATPAAECIDYAQPWLRSVSSVPAPYYSFGPEVEGNLLLLPAWNHGIGLYDLTDAEAPLLLGTLNLPSVRDVAVQGSLAVAANGPEGVAVVDLSVPSAPVLVGTVDTPGDAVGIAMSGGYAYVADWNGGFQVVSLAVPASPVLVGSLPAPGGEGHEVRDVAVSGGFAFLACGASGLLSVEVTAPAAPLVRDALPEAGGCEAIALGGNFAYLSRSPYLSVVEVANPRDLCMKGSRAAGPYTSFIRSAGSHVLLFVHAEGFFGIPGPGVLHSFDVTDPMAPQVAGRLGEFDDGQGIAIAGDYGYVADQYGGIAVIDARNLVSPPVAASVASYGGVSASGSEGDLAYLVGYPDSWCGMVMPFFQVLDLADPESPAELSYIELNSWGMADYPAIAQYGDFVYVPLENLEIVSLAQPASPIPLGSVPLPSEGIGMAIEGTHGYVACGTSGLQVLDFADPAAPAVVGSFASGGTTLDVTVRDGIAYVGAGAAGLDLLDLTDPAHPARLALLDTPGSAGGVALAGDVAFVADGEAGLAIVDCSVPGAPVLLAVLDTPGHARRVAVDQGIAYVADGPRGLSVVDVHDPASPSLAGRAPALGYASAVRVDADYVYLVAGNGGFEVRQKQCVLAAGVAEAGFPGVAPALAIVPNPSRDGALISFAAGRAAGVRASVFDVAGRRVRELSGHRIVSGRVELAWDGRDDEGRPLASGVYLVRATWDGGAASGRVALVR